MAINSINKEILIEKIEKLKEGEFQRYVIDYLNEYNTISSSLRIYRDNEDRFSLINLIQVAEDRDFKRVRPLKDTNFKDWDWISLVEGDLKDLKKIITDEYINHLNKKLNLNLKKYSKYIYNTLIY